MKTARENLSSKLVALLDEQRVLLAVIHEFGTDDYTAYLQSLAWARSASRRDLEGRVPGVESRVKGLRRKLRPRLKPEVLRALPAMLSSEEPGHLVYMDLWHLESLFAGIGNLIQTDRYLKGTTIGIGFCGIAQKGICETTATHVSLYEDLAAHWNRAMRLKIELAKLPAGSVQRWQPETKVRIKDLHSSLRSAAITAVFMVEAYMNALSFDHLIRQGANLGKKQRQLLSEYDEDRGRPIHLSLRDKILKYPKIIAGVEHPPLAESNCPEIGVLVQAGKDYRDSVVHASPHLEAEEGAFPVSRKHLRFFSMELQPIGEVVDAAIEVIRQIEGLLSPDIDRVRWLLERRADGSFPVEAFG